LRNGGHENLHPQLQLFKIRQHFCLTLYYVPNPKAFAIGVHFVESDFEVRPHRGVRTYRHFRRHYSW